MKRWAFLVSLSLAAPLAATAADSAFPKRKPGLWEFELDTSGRGAGREGLEEKLARMPPEKRAQVEQAMRDRGMAATPAGGVKARLCLKPDDAAREVNDGVMPKLDRKGRCEKTTAVREANGFRFKAMCTKDDGEVVSVDGVARIESERTAFDMNVVSSNGRSATMHQTARWIAEDCGTLK